MFNLYDVKFTLTRRKIGDYKQSCVIDLYFVELIKYSAAKMGRYFGNAFSAFSCAF